MPEQCYNTARQSTLPCTVSLCPLGALEPPLTLKARIFSVPFMPIGRIVKAGWHGELTWTAELQTMLGVTASVMPAALRFSCHLLFSARPPSRIACTGSQASRQPGQHLGTWAAPTPAKVRPETPCHVGSLRPRGTGKLSYILSILPRFLSCQRASTFTWRRILRWVLQGTHLAGADSGSTAGVLSMVQV